MLPFKTHAKGFCRRKNNEKIKNKKNSPTMNNLLRRVDDTARERQKTLVGREAGRHINSKARTRDCLAHRAKRHVRGIFVVQRGNGVVMRLKKITSMSRHKIAQVRGQTSVLNTPAIATWPNRTRVAIAVQTAIWIKKI
jgi:transcriptional antiterminator Rof (Rho-off)